MGRGFVRSRCLQTPIGHNQNKPRRVVGLLHYIEARDAGFLEALARVLLCRLFKCVNALGLDSHVHMNNEHGSFPHHLPGCPTGIEFCILLSDFIFRSY